MEFEFDAWNGISSLHCWNGRQIGEDNAGPYLYNEPSNNQYEECKFRDSRRGLPMNVTNLRLVMPYAADAYQLTTRLREQYIEHRELKSKRFNLIQAYLFSKFAVSIPAYLTRRREKPVPDGKLPALETAFFMLGTAPFMMVRQLMVRGDPTPLERQPMSAERLYQLANACGVLISTRTCACPASPKLIREFFDVIMNGSFNGPVDSPDVGRVFESLGDWGRFYRYAQATSRLELLIKLNQALTASSLFTARDRDHSLRPKHGNNSLYETVLRTALNRSHVKAANVRDYRVRIRNVVEILCALLKDHGEDDVLDTLAHGDHLHIKSIESSVARYDALQDIEQFNAYIYAACQRNLKTVHCALGQQNWPNITAQDLLRRTGGPGLPKLLSESGLIRDTR